jgi:hypothetical protein
MAFSVWKSGNCGIRLENVQNCLEMVMYDVWGIWAFIAVIDKTGLGVLIGS